MTITTASAEPELYAPDLTRDLSGPGHTLPRGLRELRLVDVATGAAGLPVMDAADRCLCPTSLSTYFLPAHPTHLTAFFAAPGLDPAQWALRLPGADALLR